MNNEKNEKKALYHKELDVWKKSMDLVTVVYEITAKFPKEEIYCLTNQIRRSAISIPANIAEGSARKSQKEFSQFLSIALGSLAELDTEIEIAQKLGYLNSNEKSKLATYMNDIRKMIIGLMKSIEKRNARRETRNV